MFELNQYLQKQISGSCSLLDYFNFILSPYNSAGDNLQFTYSQQNDRKMHMVCMYTCVIVIEGHIQTHSQ